jgi:hypothetical protein
VLLHVADLPSEQNRLLLTNVFRPNLHFTALRLDQAIETAEQRGFPRPAFSDQRYSGPGRNINADIVERDHVPEPVGDISRS